MTTDLEALVVAAYVFADESPVPPRPGRPARISDAELVAWFPHLPSQSQYNRRLRALVDLIAAAHELAGELA